jgi:tetratricopeptide (TPR) repeat protein
MRAGKFIKKANHLKRIGKLDEAINLYWKAIKVNPNFSWYYYELGDVLEKQGNFERAAIEYEKAVELNYNVDFFHQSLQRVKNVVNKIPCVILIYYNTDIIQTSVEALSKRADILDIYIIENRSQHTEKEIKPYIFNKIKEEKVKKYFLFETNISNNAVETIFNHQEIDFGNSEYILLTEGDVLPLDYNWLSEQISILQADKEVFCCSVALDISNLPVKAFPESPGWLPQPIAETESYFEVGTGAQLLLFRTLEFQEFLEYRKQTNSKFRDGTMIDYCYKVKQKKWVKTKKALTKHLTWDLYHNLDHPYTKLKLSKDLNQIWNHDFYSSYEIYGKDYYARSELADGLKPGKVFD